MAGRLSQCVKCVKMNQRCYQTSSREKTNVAAALLGEGYGVHQALRHQEAPQEVLLCVQDCLQCRPKMCRSSSKLSVDTSAYRREDFRPTDVPRWKKMNKNLILYFFDSMLFQWLWYDFKLWGISSKRGYATIIPASLCTIVQQLRVSLSLHTILKYIRST